MRHPTVYLNIIPQGIAFIIIYNTRSIIFMQLSSKRQLIKLWNLKPRDGLMCSYKNDVKKLTQGSVHLVIIYWWG